MKRIAILALSISLGLAACSKKEEAAPAANSQFQNHARVLQVKSAGGYTYIEAMGETGEKIWMAGAPIEVKVGDMISFGQYSIMNNFSSKALGQSFERIVFVDSWAAGGKVAKVASHGTAPAGGAGMPQGHPPMGMGGMPGGHPPMGMGGMPAAGGGGNSGVVKTVQSSGGYTYVEVQQGAGSVWVAAPETKVKVGDKVAWDGGSMMTNFQAKSLNRTFAQIIFAGGITVTN